MSGLNTPYAKWREELNQLVDDARTGRVPASATVVNRTPYLEAIQVRLLLEQVVALDRIGDALDALVAARYGG